MYKRVLVVTPRYFPQTGGVETHVYETARRLARRFDITILTTDPGFPIPNGVAMDDVVVVRVAAHPKASDLYFAPDIYPRIIRGRWDLVHCQSYHTAVAPLAMLAARRAHIPYLMTFHSGGHSSRLRHALRPLHAALLSPLLRQAKRLICVSQFEREHFAQALGLPSERFITIPNGITLQQPDATVPKDVLTILSVGRLERYKRHQRLIAALPWLRQQLPQVRLRIIGTGPFEAELRRIAHQCGVEDQVEIMAIPGAARDKMTVEYQRASLLVLLSEYEANPLAVLEALGMGLPALVADNSGMHDLVKAGWAHGLPENATEKDLAMTLYGLLTNPSPQVFRLLPTWDDCAEQLAQLYDSILSAKQ